MIRLVTALIILMIASGAAIAQSLPAPSYWINQRGSEMRIFATNPQGGFTGIYINHAPGFQCQNTPFDMQGQTMGTRVTFTVVWKNPFADCQSQTVWSGRIRGETMTTRWVLTGPGINPSRGTDMFWQKP